MIEKKHDLELEQYNSILLATIDYKIEHQFKHLKPNEFKVAVHIHGKLKV